MTSFVIRLKVLVAVILFLAACPPLARATTIDFESLADLEIVTNQFSGVVFSNAVALQSFTAAGGSLFDDDFPPASGVTVVSNGDQSAVGGSIVLDFTTPVTSVSGLFTYAGPLTLTAFDAAAVQVAQVLSGFTENFVSSGNSPNELLQLAFATGITQLRIDVAPTSTTFTLDDLTFEPLVITAVPGPPSFGLIAAGVLGIMAAARALRLVRLRRAR